MTRWTRWIRFNGIGALGMLVQLASLGFLQRRGLGRFRVATVASVELALLHNFAWHWKYTWRDRRDSVTPFRRLLRFQLSNGLTSICGNLAVLQLLVRRAHWPLLPANFVAIVACSVANYSLADRWTFARRETTDLPSEKSELERARTLT